MQRPPEARLSVRMFLDVRVQLQQPSDHEQIRNNLLRIAQMAFDEGLITGDTGAFLEEYHTGFEPFQGSQVVTCVYCGHEYPHGTPAAKAQALTDHIKVCEKHPMREREQLIAKCLDKIKEETDGVLGANGDLFQAVCVLISQRDNAYNDAETRKGWLEKAYDCDVDTLRLLKVYYGRDVGLVSLRRGKILVTAEEEITVPSGTPQVTIHDSDMSRIYGAEHNWSDVLELLTDKYDWKSKNLEL